MGRGDLYPDIALVMYFQDKLKYLERSPHPCHRLNALELEQISDRLKPATVLNLIIRCQKRSLLIISLFFNDKVTSPYS